MLHIKKDQLSKAQQDVANLVERIEAINAFDSGQLMRRWSHEFAKDRALPFLGRAGIIECAELFMQSGLPSLVDDDAMGSVSVSRHLRQVKGCPEGVYTPSQYVVMEQIDGHGVRRVGVDPYTLTTDGTYEKFVIFGKNTVSRYSDKLSIQVADDLLCKFVEIRPVPIESAD